MNYKKAGISVVVITKNEEEKIKKCLDSLKHFVDQIVVVDDKSSDKTVDICKTYGAKVIINESYGNFDKQRNIGIEHADYEWILQMDADEIVPEETADKIKKAINNSGDFVAFKLKRKNFLMSHHLRYAGAYDYAIKLFKKGKASYTGKSIHETLEVKGLVGIIDADIFHYPINSINNIIQKWNFYSEIIAKEYVNKHHSINFKKIKYRLTWKSIKLFWKLYIKKKGYKDGMYGLLYGAF